MPDLTVVQPDLEFKRQVLGSGAHDLVSCYQCGTCSVVCPISDEKEPFPRKEMIWAQWGLKDKLMADKAIWLCHQCNTCSTYCPRDAKPGDLMATLRDYSIKHYAFPAVMGKWVNSSKYLPILFGIPIFIFLVILGLAGNLGGFPTGEIVFAKFVPHIYIDITFILASGFAVFAGFHGGKRYWQAMSAASNSANGADAKKSLIAALLTIFKHSEFKRCSDEKGTANRPSHKGHLHKSHIGIFYGFVGLFITTTSVAIGIYVFQVFPPLHLLNPVKLLGNFSGILFVGACSVLIYKRMSDKEKAGKSTYNDLLFLWVLLLVGVTGYLSEFTRLAEMAALAYSVYFVHLVFVFVLLAYLPYSKFAHLIYRPVAMWFSKSRQNN